MVANIASRARSAYERANDFFGREIWERRLRELSGRQARRYRAARILQRTFRSLILDDQLHVRAAALTYFTVLSLVPLLAFAFALLKGFGAYEALVDGTIRPYALRFLAGNQALRDAFERILGFVEGTGVTSLGFIGLLFLLYAATRLLRNIEGAFNEIWCVESGRDPVQQFRDYVSIIVIMPLCLMAAAGLTTAGQAQRMLRSAGESVGLGGVVDQLIGILGPLAALFAGLSFLYKVMPHTHVRARSAALGGAIGAIAWYLVLVAHVSFQIGVARFNALYSSFAALPIFLAWLQVSWLMVLIGAQVAATHQNGRALAQRRRLASIDQARRESVTIAAMLRIGASFASEQPPASLEQLAEELDVDEAFLAELLGPLVSTGLLVRTEPATDPRYAPARPIETIRLKDVLDALRRSPHGRRAAEQAMPTARGEAIWHELDDALAHAPENRTLAELIAADAEQ